MTTISPLLYKSAEDELPTIWRVFIVGGETDILFSPDGKNGQRVKETEYVGGGIFDRKMYTTAIKGSTLPPITNRQWKELPYMFDIESLVQFYVTPTIMKIIGCDTNYPYNYSFINSSVGLQEEKRALQRLNQIINDPKTSINAQRSFKQLYTTICRSFETAVDNLASNDGSESTLMNGILSKVGGLLNFVTGATDISNLQKTYTKEYIKDNFKDIDRTETGRKSLYAAFLQMFEDEEFDSIEDVKSAVETYIYEKYPRTGPSGKDKKYNFTLLNNTAEKITTQKYIEKINNDDDWIPDIVWVALKERYFDTNVIEVNPGGGVSVQGIVYENASNTIVLKHNGNNWNWMAPNNTFNSTSSRFIDKV